MKRDDLRRTRKLRNAVVEGCREMAEVYGEMEREFNPLEEEAHRALAQPSRHGDYVSTA